MWIYQSWKSWFTLIYGRLICLMLMSVFNEIMLRTHRQYFSSSFYPSVVQEWNQLPSAIQNSHSLDTFCRALKGHIQSTLKTPWYGQGDRFLDIQHTIIRLGCSKLKFHLYYNLFVENNPHFMCGHINEDPQHYFFHCLTDNAQFYWLRYVK